MIPPKKEPIDIFTQRLRQRTEQDMRARGAILPIEQADRVANTDTINKEQKAGSVDMTTDKKETLPPTKTEAPAKQPAAPETADKPDLPLPGVEDKFAAWLSKLADFPAFKNPLRWAEAVASNPDAMVALAAPGMDRKFLEYVNKNGAPNDRK